MYKLSSVLLSVFSLITIVSCSNKDKQTTTNLEENNVAVTTSLLGHTILATYPEMKAEIQYLSDSVLHWETITDGNVAQDEEVMYQKRVGENLFFVNWIEADGTTVSQVVDFKNHKISVFLTYFDESNPRGQRTSNFFEGTFEIIK